MKKEPRVGKSVKKGDGNDLRRTTVFFTENLDANLDILAIQEDKSKGQLIREILSEAVRKKGLDPTRKIVNIKVRY